LIDLETGGKIFFNLLVFNLPCPGSGVTKNQGNDVAIAQTPKDLPPVAMLLSIEIVNNHCLFVKS